MKTKGKNHVMLDGRLINQNKRFSDLKNTQKEQIYEVIKEAYLDAADEKGNLTKDGNAFVINRAEAFLEKRKIWLPSSELVRYFNSKKNQLKKLNEIKINISNEQK